MSADQVNSLVFGVAVMVLAVVSVLVVTARAVKLTTARVPSTNQEYAALLRRYEALSSSTAANLGRHIEEVTGVRSRLTQIQEAIDR